MSGDVTPTIKQPQITCYREYVLEPNANVALSFDDATAKQAFENSLFRKVWGATGTGDYPNQPNNNGFSVLPFS